MVMTIGKSVSPHVSQVESKAVFKMIKTLQVLTKEVSWNVRHSIVFLFCSILFVVYCSFHHSNFNWKRAQVSSDSMASAIWNWWYFFLFQIIPRWPLLFWQGCLLLQLWLSSPDFLTGTELKWIRLRLVVIHNSEFEFRKVIGFAPSGYATPTRLESRVNLSANQK